MQLELAQMAQDEQELQKLNEQLKIRAQKFNSQFTPLTLSEFKLFKIKKASQTGNIKFLQGLLLNDIADLQQRKQTIQSRTAKFFQTVQVQSDPNKFFGEKTVPDFSEDSLQLRQNTWYLFGVDYMSNQRIRHYFASNPHFRIEWINDSACNIVYNTREEAIQAIRPYIKQGDQMKDENSQIWYELQEYDVQGVKRKLFCRLSTNRDSKKESQHGHQSKYYRWVIDKQKLGNFVKQSAKKEIYRKGGELIKTKGIAKKPKKREESDDEGDSSSGVNSSAEEDKPNIVSQDQGQKKDNMKNQELDG